MGPDAANIVSSLARSMDVDRAPNVTQRASDAAQAELAEESFAVLDHKKAEAATQLNREKIRREHEKRRREMERRDALGKLEEEPEDSGSGLDVAV